MLFTRSVHCSAKYELKRPHRPHFFLISDKNNKNIFLIYKKLFGRTDRHQLPN